MRLKIGFDKLLQKFTFWVDLSAQGNRFSVAVDTVLYHGKVFLFASKIVIGNCEQASLLEYSTELARQPERVYLFFKTVHSPDSEFMS